MNKTAAVLLSLIACLFPCLTEAQTTSHDRNLQEVISCAENYLGTNDLLLNGHPYFPLHPLAKGFPYFETESWTSGALFVKGSIFEVSDLKYNMETDQAVLKTKFRNGSNTLTALNPALVDSFRLGERTFVNLAIIDGGNSGLGYAEKIYSGGIHFYRKHQKSFIDTYNNITPQGSYSQPELSYFIYSQHSLVRLSGKSDFVNYFEKNKKLVNKFIKQEKIQFNKSSREELHSLLKYCDGLY